MELQAFKTLFDDYYHPIKNFLYYKLGDVSMAEGLTQDVFMNAWEKKDQAVKPTAPGFQNWL